jgi:hypothetical protein
LAGNGKHAPIWRTCPVGQLVTVLLAGSSFPANAAVAMVKTKQKPKENNLKDLMSNLVLSKRVRPIHEY